MKYLFLIYLFLGPLFFQLDKTLRTAQEWFFQLGGLILIVATMFFNNKPIRKDKFNISLAAFVLWIIATYIIFRTGWSVMFNCILGILIYLSVIRTLKREDCVFLFRCITYVGVLAIIWLAGQYFNYDLRAQIMMGQLGGMPTCSFFGLKAPMGMYFAILLPLLLSFSWTGLLLLFPLALSYSSGAVAAGIGATFFYLWFRKRVAFWVALAPIVIGGVLFVVFMDMPLGMMNTRIPMWGLVIQDINRKPLGQGLDSFRQPSAESSVRYYKYSFNDKTVRIVKKGEDWIMGDIPPKGYFDKIKEGKNPLDYWDHPHNEYIWLTHNTGFPGLILLGIFLFFGINRFLRSKRGKEETALAAAIFAILLMCMTQFPFHVARVGHIIPIILGLFYITTEE